MAVGPAAERTRRTLFRPGPVPQSPVDATLATGRTRGPQRPSRRLVREGRPPAHSQRHGLLPGVGETRCRGAIVPSDSPAGRGDPEAPAKLLELVDARRLLR